jgi:hypothetical protein
MKALHRGVCVGMWRRKKEMWGRKDPRGSFGWEGCGEVRGDCGVSSGWVGSVVYCRGFVGWDGGYVGVCSISEV